MRPGISVRPPPSITIASPARIGRSETSRITSPSTRTSWPPRRRSWAGSRSWTFRNTYRVIDHTSREGMPALGSVSFSSTPRERREPLARGQLVLVRAEGHRVVAAGSRRLQPGEQRLEIDGALTGVEVDLVLAPVVGHAPLADAAHAEV